jgi:hypothetical protein
MEASGDGGSVSGGKDNGASGIVSSVSGDGLNEATEHNSSVSGGQDGWWSRFGETMAPPALGRRWTHKAHR